MHKRAEIDRIDFQPDGTMMVRISKYIVDDDGSILNLFSDNRYHATSFAPSGQDHEATIDANNADLTRQGYGAVPYDQWDNVRNLIAVKHTPETIAAHAAKIAARQAEREAEIAAMNSTP